MSRIVDQKKQQGSVASFIVTGVLLSTVFIGSIVAVKKQFGTNKSDSNDATKIAKTEDKKVSDNTSTSTSTSKSKESTSKDTGNNNKETESQKKPDSLKNNQAEQKKLEEEAKKKSDTEKQQNQTGAPQQSNPNQELQNQNQQTQLSGASSEALPTTGPIEDIFMMVIGAVAIFGSGYVYYHYGYGRK
ncbi:hypothetical protein HG429_003230 [Candidatus Saccharibacteria bacterium]|jgi:hypothetical protein cdiviTM7_01550|nr:hypothetical protein [Candidatus Saccharibacteria bacterium]